MKNNKDPLIVLLEMKQKAIKNKSHYKIINNIELNIKKEARFVVDQFIKTNDAFPVMESLIYKRALK